MSRRAIEICAKLLGSSGSQVNVKELQMSVLLLNEQHRIKILRMICDSYGCDLYLKKQRDRRYFRIVHRGEKSMENYTVWLSLQEDAQFVFPDSYMTSGSYASVGGAITVAATRPDDRKKKPTFGRRMETWRKMVDEMDKEMLEMSLDKENFQDAKEFERLRKARDKALELKELLCSTEKA
jgi:hypothetical protein